MFLVLDFCSGGNLASYLRQHGRVQEKIAKRFTQQMGSGHLISSHHIIHRDLKPENILLSGKESDVVLITMWRQYADLHYTWLQKFFNFKDMIIRVGVILFELLNGYPPFRAFSLLQNIKSSSCLPFSQHIPSGLHPDCVDICSRLLSANPGLAHGLTLTKHIFLSSLPTRGTIHIFLSLSRCSSTSVLR
ncbi:hypothetical protein DKX38_029013 [Salix brachista]|nr:hypothetical protein DKX38_029013 [Salix brachista]